MSANEKNNIDKIIGGNIRARRKALGMTQSQLASKCGLTAITISRVELGERQVRRTSMHEISAALGCKETDFVTNEGAVRGEFSRAYDVLFQLESLEPDLRSLVLSLIYKKPTLAPEYASFEVSELLLRFRKKQK